MRPRSLAECTLLLVDDEAPNLELLEEFLLPEALGRLIGTSDARRAVPLFEAHRPDLVLLDLHMPFVSGFEVLREIRQRLPAGDFVPVLILTADASRSTRARALSEGAHDFLTKPLDALEVRLRVRNLLNTRLLHLEQRSAREAAESATAARELILSVVAHDLRNPLASITMDAEMARHLLPDGDGSAPGKALRRIERTAKRMHGQIEDLLDISRLEHGTFAIRAEPTPLGGVLSEAESMLQPLARARGVALAFAGTAALPIAPVDSARMLQVFSNLVGNALKFTPEGGSVRVAWQVEEGGLAVSISDTGPGIPPEQLPRVFDTFWQGRGARNGNGIGLGLPITRAIVEAHGGRVWIESSEGIGTTARFTIPLHGSREPAAADAPSAPPSLPDLAT